MFSHQPLNPITSKIIEKIRIDFFIADDSLELDILAQENIEPLPKAPTGKKNIFLFIICPKSNCSKIMLPKFPIFLAIFL